MTYEHFESVSARNRETLNVTDSSLALFCKWSFHFWFSIHLSLHADTLRVGGRMGELRKPSRLAPSRLANSRRFHRQGLTFWAARP
jgi:hypothetical protein